MEKESKIIPDEVLNKALRLSEQGKTTPEILNLFQEYREELAEIFELTSSLAEERETVRPPGELLTKILSQIPGVTEKEKEGYLYWDEKSLFAKWKKSFTLRLIPAGAILAIFILVMLIPLTIDLDETIFVSQDRKSKEKPETQKTVSSSASEKEKDAKTASGGKTADQTPTDDLTSANTISEILDISLLEAEAASVSQKSAFDEFISTEQTMDEMDQTLLQI